jgi:hypothetical protein
MLKMSLKILKRERERERREKKRMGWGDRVEERDEIRLSQSNNNY